MRFFCRCSTPGEVPFHTQVVAWLWRFLPVPSGPIAIARLLPPWLAKRTPAGSGFLPICRESRAIGSWPRPCGPSIAWSTAVAAVATAIPAMAPASSAAFPGATWRRCGPMPRPAAAAPGAWAWCSCPPIRPGVSRPATSATRKPPTWDWPASVGGRFPWTPPSLARWPGRRPR